MRALTAAALAGMATAVATVALAPNAVADFGNGNSSKASAGRAGVSIRVSTAGHRHAAAPGSSRAPVPDALVATAPRTRAVAPPPTPPCGIRSVAGSVVPRGSGPVLRGGWLVNTCRLGINIGGVRWAPGVVVPSPGRTATASMPPVAPAVLARQALASAPWPSLAVGTNPPGGRLVVNFPTWLFLRSGWQRVSATARVPGLSATVVARPVWARWSMGDGHVVVCRGAGAPYDTSLSWQANLARRSCGYTYRTSSSSAPGGRFTVTVTLHYSVGWSSTTGASGSLGGYARRISAPVVVGQVEALQN